MTETWTTCPECGVGRNQDHERTCSRGRRRAPTVYGSGTPLEAISPHRGAVDQPHAVVDARERTQRVEAEFAERGGPAPDDDVIKLSAAELQSGLDRVRWAEGLVEQLPPDHEGRNTWLLNYGVREEALGKRARYKIEWDEETRSARTRPRTARIGP